MNDPSWPRLEHQCNERVEMAREAHADGRKILLLRWHPGVYKMGRQAQMLEDIEAEGWRLDHVWHTGGDTWMLFRRA